MAEPRNAESGFTRRWRRMTLSLTLLLVLIEGGYMLLVAYAGPFMAQRVAGPLTLGLALGALATFAGWAIACFYVLWANRAQAAAAVAP